MKHEVLKLWKKPASGAEMEPHRIITLETGRGIVEDASFNKRRHVTIVFADDWAEAGLDLSREVDPVGRRANILVSGGGCERLLTSTIRIGPVEITVGGITSPCERMDDAQVGLMDVLKIGGRPGIWGRITAGGTIRIGDTLSRT